MQKLAAKHRSPLAVAANLAPLLFAPTAAAQGAAPALPDLSPRAVELTRGGDAGELLLASASACTPDWQQAFLGPPGPDGSVFAIAVFDDGSGPALYAAGDFTVVSGTPASRIARWDGAHWTALDAGLDSVGRTLCVFDDGSGQALYVGGTFQTAGGQPAPGVARWDGQSWSAVGGGIAGEVHALELYEDGGGTALYAAGEFASAGGVAASRVARWDGAAWSALGAGVDDTAYALGVFDDGGGPALCVGGQFDHAGGLAADGVARWDGQAWSAIGAGVDGPVRTLAMFDDGSGGGERLFAGGYLFHPSGAASAGVVRWDGQAWEIIGSGLAEWVLALAPFDDGAGTALYAAGSGGVVARWDGATWTPVVAPALTSTHRALCAFDDGSGAGMRLFLGGTFDDLDWHEIRNLAAWNGAKWTQVSGCLNDQVHELAVFDDGTVPALYAAGEFTGVGPEGADYLARWDGSVWRQLGEGVDNVVYALEVYDDGSGPALYVGGLFDLAGGVAAPRIARWDGQAWSGLGASPSSTVLALTGFDDGSGTALFVGGLFEDSPAGDAFLTRWGCPPSSVETVPGCFGNPATLTALTPELVIGEPFTASLQAAGLADGLGVLRAGLDPTDPAGCGLLVPGLGELLLALAPQVELASGALTGGSVTFLVPVPDVPSIVGVEIALQGAAVAPVPAGLAIELSNGLVATLGQ